MIKKGILSSTNSKEILVCTNLFINRAIPVTPPSKNPLGSKKAFKPILAKTIPSAICAYSDRDFMSLLLFESMS